MDTSVPMDTSESTKNSWECDVCNQPNLAHWVFCNHCGIGTPLKGESDGGVVKTKNDDAKHEYDEPDANEWACSHCTFFNPLADDTCKICNAQRPTEDESVNLQGREPYTLGHEVIADESREVEFKAVKISRRPVDNILLKCRKYLVAFLNAKGGTIYFGIEDDGMICGVELNREARDKISTGLDSVRRTFDPRLPNDQIELNFIPVVRMDDDGQKQTGRWVVEVSVPQGEHVYASEDCESGHGEMRCWVRGFGSVGAKNGFMTHTEIAARGVFLHQLKQDKERSDVAFQMPNPVLRTQISTKPRPSPKQNHEKKPCLFYQTNSCNKAHGACPFPHVLRCDFHFSKKGCREGHNCEFSHHPSLAKCQPITKCKHGIVRNGKCKFGDDCPYRHERVSSPMKFGRHM